MRLRTIAAAVALALPAVAYATDGYFQHGYGMKAIGMGGTSIAVTGDAFGGANNPATMAYAGNQFAIGATLFSPHRKAERTGGDAFGLSGSAESDSNYFGIPEVGYSYMVRPDVGLGITVFVSIETGDHSQDWLKRFADVVGAMPEVMEFYRMAGDVDYMLRVVVADIAGYDAFYKKLIATVPLKNVTSRFAMERIKSTTALPIAEPAK
jgi:DNA-binding Lrp family transcriptional regulator